MSETFKPAKQYFNQLVYALGNYHYNWHPEIELLLVLQGQVVANVDGMISPMQPGDLILINSNQGHATRAASPHTLAIRTHIAPQFFTTQGVQIGLNSFALNSVTHPDQRADAAIRRAIAKLYFAHNDLVANSAAYRLADLLYEHAFCPTHQPGMTYQQQALMTKVAADIQQKFHDQLTLGYLAQRYGYSQSYFSKLFKQEFGIGFYEYLTRQRLKFALKELNRDADKISTIAFNSGFTEVKSFNRAFKKHFGVTPTNYQSKIIPQVRAVDAHFQGTLSSIQQQTAHQFLRKLLTPDPVNNLPDCDHCLYKQDSVRYHVMRQQLKALLDDKN